MGWMDDNSEGREVLDDWTAERINPPRPRSTPWYRAAGMGLVRGGIKVAKGAALLSSPLLPHEWDGPGEYYGTKESAFRLIDRLDEKEREWTPDPQSVGLAGQIVGAISELPLQLIGGPATMIGAAIANTGISLVNQGVDPVTATAAAIGAGAANAVMLKLPQAGRNWKETLGLVGLNPLMGVGQDLALKQGLEERGYQEQAKAINPLDPAARSVDLVLGGVFGALGYHANRVNAKARATALEHVATRAEEYHDLIAKAGGEQAIRDRLPVEVVDSLDTVSQHLKSLESNPLDSKVLDGVDRHLGMLKKALADVSEGKPADVAEHVADLVKPPERPLELQTLMDKWSARYGLAPDEEAGVASLIQARATAMGMGVDEFVGKYFADVTNEPPEKNSRNVLYQHVQDVDGVKILQPPEGSKIAKGVHVASYLPAHDTQNLFETSRLAPEQALQKGVEYYHAELEPNPVNARAFNGEPVAFTQRGLDHLTGEERTVKISAENTARRLKLLPKVKTVLESTPFVDEVRTKEGGKEYGLLGRFSDGSVIRVVVEEIHENGKTFYSVFDWEDVAKKLRRSPLPESPRDMAGSGVGKAPADHVTEDSILRNPGDDQALHQGEKGAVSFLADGRAVIHALEQPDFSTAVHELAHVFARTLEPGEKLAFDKWLLNHSRGKGEWTRGEHEAFARAFEKYLSEGKAPTPELQGVFDKFKSWLLELYRSVVGSPLELRLHPEAAKAFDRLLFNEMIKKDVNPETVRVQQEASALVADRDADLHLLAGTGDQGPGTGNQGPGTRNQKKPSPVPDPPSRILRDLALHTYEDPELIKRFVSEPTKVAGALAHALELEAGKIEAAEPPEWFQRVTTQDRRTGKFGDALNQAAQALRRTAAGEFHKLPEKQQDVVLSALDAINYTAQEHAREIDAQELQVGDRYLTTDFVYHTVTAERDGQLILNNGERIPMTDALRILGEVDQSGRPPEKGYDPLDYQVESLLEERGDFPIHVGTDAAGNDITRSARELIDEAKDAVAVHKNHKHLYDRAAACMGLEF